MKVIIKVEKEVDLKTLHVEAGVRYWEDSEVNGEEYLRMEDEYVPGFMSINDNGYGDYIIMEIDKTGRIKDWKFSIEDLNQEED